MNKSELVELLETMAKKDLTDGADISDHPCSVAIRAINQSFDDIEFLKRIISGAANKQSKRAYTIRGLTYNPTW